MHYKVREPEAADSAVRRCSLCVCCLHKFRFILLYCVREPKKKNPLVILQQNRLKSSLLHYRESRCFDVFDFYQVRFLSAFFSDWYEMFQFVWSFCPSSLFFIPYQPSLLCFSFHLLFACSLFLGNIKEQFINNNYDIYSPTCCFKSVWFDWPQWNTKGDVM